MKLSIKLLATLLMTQGATQPLLAADVQEPENEEAKEAPAKAERVQVWGTKIYSSSLFLNESDIAVKQADHLSDLLRGTPGVDVGGTHSTNQRINIRGQEDTDLEVLIDGAVQNNYMYHHMGNLLINPDLLKSADIQVGSNSIIYGGLGGSVQFETKDARDFLVGEERVGGRARLAWQSNKAMAYSLTGYGRVTDTVDVLAYTYLLDRGNYKDGNGRETFGRKGRMQNHLAKAGFDVSESQRIELSFDIYTDKGDYSERPDMGTATNEAISGDLLFPTEYSRQTASLRHELDLGPGFTSQAVVYGNILNLERTSNLTTGTETKGRADNSGLRWLAQSRVATDDVQQTFSYGLQHNTLKQKYEQTGAAEGKEQADSSAVFIEDRVAVGPVALTPGVRFNRYTRELHSGDSKTWDNVSGALGLEYKVLSNLELHASGTQLFQGPDLSQIFIGSGGNKIYNPDLKPETGLNTEGGVRFRDKDVLGADRISFSLNVFETRIKDIVQEQDYPLDADTSRGAPVWDYNAEGVKITGMEASFHYGLGNFSGLLGYGHSKSKLDDTGYPLERELGDSYNVTLNYFAPSLETAFSWSALFVLEEKDHAPGAQKKAPYEVHNVSLNWQPQNGWDKTSVIFGIDNIFDKHYASHASRTGVTVHPVFGVLETTDFEPGRNVKLTLSQAF
ncbi:TonB-dependent receptor domain-containing protein [Oligoflexus tunisiensis]|uniref:TonB-dependent receptor domain-containing protein n=1 Tax=Oligoflexus tunisiensis TaxID=708132 RepID=UPI000AC585D2|nr:TonB-dependent receptor [Oligoflexus tunisiensis]